MIIKIWRYESKLKGVAGPNIKQRLGFDTALSRARYIFNIQLTENDLLVMETIKPIGDYVTSQSKEGHRIAGRHAYNLVSDDPVGQTEEIALQGARAGLERFWHIVVSNRPGEVLTPEDREHIRQVVCRILGVEKCPSIWATHTDEPHVHDHGLVVSYLAAEDQPVTFGQDWWKEAGQIAMAILERDLDLDPEPNRRFVADETGVYHTFSDIKVADQDGNILDGKIIRAMQRKHNEWKHGNDTPPHHRNQDEWAFERAVEVLVTPRIKAATTSAELRESLARVGFRYVVGQSGARLVANGYQPGPGINIDGKSISAGAAYPNAALGKLSKRLGGILPEPPGFKVCKFVMPRYNKRDLEERSQFRDHRVALEECNELATHLSKGNSHWYRKLRDTEKGEGVNADRKARRLHHEEEAAQVATLKTSLSQRPGRSLSASALAAAEQPTISLAFLWGGAARQQTSEYAEREAIEREEIEKRYRIEQSRGERRYWLDKELAFVERLRTIEIISRKRQARIDALKLARRRFSALRITAKQLLRERLAKIAGELGIAICAGPLGEIGAAHREAVASGNASSQVDASRLYHDTKTERKKHRAHDLANRKLRDERIEKFYSPHGSNRIEFLVSRFVQARDASSLGDETRGGPEQVLHKLKHDIDHNALWLASSRYNQEYGGTRYRYLDDDALVATFKEHPEDLIDPVVQRTLAAIEAVQIEQRRWIAAALLAGRATLEDDELKLAGVDNHWAPAFWKAQRDDPTFRRLIVVSRARPDRFASSLEMRPGEEALRAARARGYMHLARAIAEEMALQTRLYPAVRTGARSTKSRSEVSEGRATDSSTTEKETLGSAKTDDGASKSLGRRDPTSRSLQHPQHDPKETQR